MFRNFSDRAPNASEIIELERKATRDGCGLSLTETARVMYAHGHFDRVPDKKTIYELQQRAMAKLRKGLAL